MPDALTAAKFCIDFMSKRSSGDRNAPFGTAGPFRSEPRRHDYRIARTRFPGLRQYRLPAADLKRVPRHAETVVESRAFPDREKGQQ